MDNDDPDLAEPATGLEGAAPPHQPGKIILLQKSSSTGASATTSERFVRLGDAMRGAMASSDPSFRKAYLRLFVDSITVNNTEVAITGPKAALAKACALDELPPAAAVAQFVEHGVPCAMKVITGTT